MQTDNPPAFPLQASDGDDMNAPEYGMSLRDWFAGQALAAVGNPCDWTAPGDAELLAARLYRVADAMLTARVS